MSTATRLVALLSLTVLAFGCQPPARHSTHVANVSGSTGPVAGDVVELDGPRKLKAVQSTALRTAIATAASSRLNSGTARLYSGASKASQNADGTVAALTGTLIATWTLSATAFTVSNGVATLAGVPLTATAAATAALSSSNTTSGYIVFIGSGNAIEVIASAGLTGSGAEMVFDVQPQSGGTVNLTGYTRTFPAGS
jgi:X-X-X-Leu-X-X-Gly heptad repeat protein